MFLLYGWPTKDITLFPVATNCQRSAPLQIFNMLQAGFEPVENLSSGLVEWSCAVVINTTPQHHYYNQYTMTLYAERLGYEFVTIFVTFVCISYFALQIRINLSRDTFLVSRRKKRLQSLHIFMKHGCTNVWYFKCDDDSPGGERAIVPMCQRFISQNS